MEDKNERIEMFCVSCSLKLVVDSGAVSGKPRSPCPACGSKLRRIAMGGAASLTMRTGHKLRVLSNTRNKKKFVIEEMDLPELFRKTGEPVRRYRRIDKAADVYHERVYTDQGCTIHECEEPLTEHRGHGSAKRPKFDPKQPRKPNI